MLNRTKNFLSWRKGNEIPSFISVVENIRPFEKTIKDTILTCSKCGYITNTCPKCGAVKKPRTTGPHSQSKHANGHIAQIAQDTGNDFDTVKLYCKREAIAEGYPHDTFNGVLIPWSETRLDTIQAGILIETIHRLAAEMNIRLQEE